jgi:hypothetical protein
LILPSFGGRWRHSERGGRFAGPFPDRETRRGLPNNLPVEDFRNLAGRGVRARVGGRLVLIGTPRLMEEQEVALGGSCRPWSGSSPKGRH